MTFKIGINWHLRFREEIKHLKEIYAEMMDGDPNEDLFDGFSGEY